MGATVVAALVVKILGGGEVADLAGPGGPTAWIVTGVAVAVLLAHVA